MPVVVVVVPIPVPVRSILHTVLQYQPATVTITTTVVAVGSTHARASRAKEISEFACYIIDYTYIPAGIVTRYYLY